MRCFTTWSGRKRTSSGLRKRTIKIGINMMYLGVTVSFTSSVDQPYQTPAPITPPPNAAASQRDSERKMPVSQATILFRSGRAPPAAGEEGGGGEADGTLGAGCEAGGGGSGRGVPHPGQNLPSGGNCCPHLLHSAIRSLRIYNNFRL